MTHATIWIETAKLVGPALNYAVAKALGYQLHHNGLLNGIEMRGWWIAGMYSDPNYWVALATFWPSTSWAQGGPIIESELLSVEAFKGQAGHWRCFEFKEGHTCEGSTVLVAAMRCFVASKLGNEVEVPEGLL